jgi:hypothetical protein
MPKTKMRLLNRPVVVTGLIATCLVAAASYLLCQVEQNELLRQLLPKRDPDKPDKQ